MLVEENQLGGIQCGAAVCERIQLKLPSFLAKEVLKNEKGKTNIVNDLGEIHDRRTVWRFNDL
jgi:hypothetical protein